MVTMVMAMVRQNRLTRLACAMAFLSILTFTPSLIAGDWDFTPNFGIEETYTDNVELTTIDLTSSLVSQAILGLDMDYKSRLANFKFSGINNSLFYSHDSDINDNYISLDSELGYYLWVDGPQLVANAEIANTTRNSANNGVADLISGDTIQSETYSSGIAYRVDNNAFSIDSSLLFHARRYEDGIDESNGVSATFNSQYNKKPQFIFWQLSSSFSTNSQDFSGETRTGEQYIIDAQLGLVMPFNWSPFIRYYDEGYSGDSFSQDQQTTSSWGPGIRWLVSPHIMVDFSYNYVADESISDDYLTASVKWEPSGRTSLIASYSQRFFGDSYSLDFKNKTKRLTNSMSYKENLEVFDRGSYEQVRIGTYWCPPEATLEAISQCFVQSGQSGSSDFRLIDFYSLEPIESNEFSLNKRFAWNSTLQLSRTSFAINTSATRREGLDSKIIDDDLDASFTIDRKISGKSNLTFSAKYNYLIFDKNNPEGSRQEDRYRTFSAMYTKDLASSLSTQFTVQHVNRDSNIERYKYEEVRAIINVTKEF